MKSICLMALAVVLVWASFADAQIFRRRGGGCADGSCQAAPSFTQSLNAVPAPTAAQTCPCTKAGQCGVANCPVGCACGPAVASSPAPDSQGTVYASRRERRQSEGSRLLRLRYRRG